MDSQNEEDHNLSSVSASDSSFITDLEGGKVTLTFTTNDLESDLENFKACRSVLDWVHPDLPLYLLEDSKRDGLDGSDRNDVDNDTHLSLLRIPSLALVVFLQEEEDYKLGLVHENFQKQPWVFHHSESVSCTTTKCAPANNLDYYRAGETGPLCGVRQMPRGKRIIRIVRFINYGEWQDNVDLYSLILGQQAEVTKPDFCLFTTGQTDDYCVQFAIKRSPKGITCTPVENVKLNFRINHPGHIVPLLPFVCDNIAERHWQSEDFDGNLIRFEAQDFIPATNSETRPDTPDLSDLVLLEPVDSDSALSDSTINAYTYSCDEQQQLKVKPNYLPLERGQVDGRESDGRFQDEAFSRDNFSSPEPSIKLENPWSPISQTDSGQYSQESQQYEQYDQSTVLSVSSPDTEHFQRRPKLCGSNCSSDLGFQDLQDRYSSSCASESRWDDRSRENCDGNDNRPIRGQWRSYDGQSDNGSGHKLDKLDVRVFRNGGRSHSDFGQSGSDGYASTCTNEESEVGSYQNCSNQRHVDLRCYQSSIKSNKQQDYKYRDHPKSLHPQKGIVNGKHSGNANGHHGSQDHLWHRKTSNSENSETTFESPQRYAFRKLKKYKASQSRVENLELFNISTYHRNKDTAMRLHHKQQKAKSFPDDLKSVSELESAPGSDTEYEHAYESIERDLQIINTALYGKSSHSKDKTIGNTKHRPRTKESLTVLDSVKEPVKRHKEIPYIQGFYV